MRFAVCSWARPAFQLLLTHHHPALTTSNSIKPLRACRTQCVHLRLETADWRGVFRGALSKRTQHGGKKQTGRQNTRAIVSFLRPGTLDLLALCQQRIQVLPKVPIQQSGIDGQVLRPAPLPRGVDLIPSQQPFLQPALYDLLALAGKNHLLLTLQPAVPPAISMSATRRPPSQCTCHPGTPPRA